VVIWVSFLAACAGTFVMFALLDPNRMQDDWVLGWETSVRLIYGLGFFFLFLVALLASKLTAWMIRTGPGRGHASGQGRRPPPNIRDPSKHNPDLSDEDWQ
jgi:hypothetical protein